MGKKNIIITGGELFNKGAQSMTFVTVDQLKRRYPDKEIILISNQDYKRDEEEKKQYSFRILQLHGIFELVGGVYKWGWNFKNKLQKRQKDNKLIAEIKKILSNTDMIIDISGYALSSQRGVKTSIAYLMKVKLAKKYGIKVFLMPQSFGPFSYKGTWKHIINKIIKKYMRYPEIIYAREEEGYELLSRKYNLRNVKKAYDLVLSNTGIDISNIYVQRAKLTDICGAHDVAIIPNMKNFQHGDKEQVLRVYDMCINHLTNLGKTVYLVRHSFEDIKACKLIKERFSQDNKVILIENEFSCIEYENLVKKFDFIIASRYHSIIHAYKNGTPCIAIGWATKYHELLKTFKQEDYILDVRKNMDTNSIVEAVDKMLEKYQEESDTILEILEEVQGENVFDIIGGEK